MIHIKQVNLTVIEMPLKKPFITHLGTVSTRQAIVIEVMDEDGLCGYGECVAFSSPWYTEETIKTALHMLKDYLIPIIFKNPIKQPDDVTTLFQSIRKNQMAKAGMETAIWDLFAKRENIPLAEYIGGVRTSVLAGAVVATNNLEDALKQTEQLSSQGYKRIKVKINPKNDYQFIQGIRSRFPHISLMADANSAYTLNDIDKLKALDDFNLLMIEQPLAVNDIVDHAVLQKQMNTPICLDESITNYHDAYSAIQLGSCKVMNIKVGRVGGLTNAKKIHDICVANNIDVWCGGMIEFGISRAHNIALASLPGFTLPGDLSSSNHYWHEDIIDPMIEVHNGEIATPKSPGLGFSINKKRINQVTILHEEYKAGKR